MSLRDSDTRIGLKVAKEAAGARKGVGGGGGSESSGTVEIPNVSREGGNLGDGSVRDKLGTWLGGTWLMPRLPQPSK